MADDKRTQPRRRRPRDESADDSYPPNYTTLPVDERRDPNQVLTDMLTRLSCLDLSGRVTKIGTHAKSGGSYSDIFHGRLLSNGKLVAIRELRAHIFPEAELKKSIALELRIWSDLEHPNVLPLLGFTLDFGPHPVFVTEWMSNGTVLDYVKANPAASVLQLSIGIAAGLRYLHKREIVHADVKSSNVLVSPTGVPSLIDFGLSRLLVISQVIMSTREAGGTFRWMAHELCGGRTPEHWRESLRTVATKESDVWAYGMTVLELLTKSYPYSHLKTDFQVFSAIGKGSLPPKPSNLMGPEEIALWQDICSPCWSSTASHRPTMSELLKDLHDLEHSIGLKRKHK
ncbi:kinase-like protein [Rickenella mellea]|uniref:Kinase-like protein n=1 Tax=Rickenella mellea TaxID=50990 RepID=A0A4Y7PMD9_9AGAM|nr:kinase-like protein [Rickenella mellea]